MIFCFTSLKYLDLIRLKFFIAGVIHGLLKKLLVNVLIFNGKHLLHISFIVSVKNLTLPSTSLYAQKSQDIIPTHS